MINTSKASQYSDYTDFVVEVDSQETYPVVLVAGYDSRAYYGASYRIWIDFDCDRMFNNREELVFDSGMAGQAVVTGQLTIPYVSKEIETRMRISMKGTDREVSDVTDMGGTVTALYEDSPPNEEKEKAFDNSDYSKYLTFHNHGWIQFNFGQGQQYPVLSYSITSGNDSPERDPRDWHLMGSLNGIDWVTIDVQTNQSFAKRHETRSYDCHDQTSYRYYRLDITRNHGSNELQFSEVRLYGSVQTPPSSCGRFPAGEVEDYTVHIGKSNEEGFENGFVMQAWEHSGNASWNITWSQVYKGMYSAQSGTIGDGESSTLSVTLDCASTLLSFWAKVSSESGCDKLVLSIDDVIVGTWSGDTDWTYVSIPITAGIHRFDWTYTKDGSVSEGEDAAWIDNIVLPVR